jgi:hypothetical protein
LQSGTDEEITTFLHEIIPKWAELDVKSKEDFWREYPKLVSFLDGKNELLMFNLCCFLDKKVHQLAGIKKQ